jgi:hypothetical protein
MERPIYITPLRWKQWKKPKKKIANFKIKRCVICLEEMGESFKIYKKKYKKISQKEIINRLHTGKPAYPPIQCDTMTLCCNHKFHKNCIRKWFKRTPTCPLCRK